MERRGKFLIPRIYYFLTPVFILLDYLGGMNIRVAVLDLYPTYKGLYYFFCILCGLIICFAPRFSAIVALFESLTIYIMTILSVFIPYFQAIEHMDDILNAEIQFASIVTPPHITNLVLAGGMAAITFKQSLNELGISDNEKIKDIRNDSNGKRQVVIRQD